MAHNDDLHVLVTGATGFIGAHVVDNLLARGIRVRAAVRDASKGEQLRRDRPEHHKHLDTVQISDFREPSSLEEAVKGVDGIIHVASPFSYNIQDNETDLVVPAINGVRSILSAAAKDSRIKRIVLTSSFASVVDISRPTPPRFTYTSVDWNPQSYDESIDKEASPVVAYRGSKKFAELAAWDFIEKEKPKFDLVTLCPPMTFGPFVHPLSHVSRLNESNATLWHVAQGKPLPVARVPFWIDVRDLAQAHVEALLRSDAGNKRYTIAAASRFSYQLAAEIIKSNFNWARIQEPEKPQEIDNSHDLDGQTAAKELGLAYRSFEESVVDVIKQATRLEGAKVGEMQSSNG